jgi:hypothetical protein
VFYLKPSPTCTTYRGGHLGYQFHAKIRNFVQDHPRNIPSKFAFKWVSGVFDEKMVLTNWWILKFFSK